MGCSQLPHCFSPVMLVTSSRGSLWKGRSLSDSDTASPVGVWHNDDLSCFQGHARETWPLLDPVKAGGELLLISGDVQFPSASLHTQAAEDKTLTTSP